jgi:hypothetical protein
VSPEGADAKNIRTTTLRWADERKLRDVSLQGEFAKVNFVRMVL